MPSEFPQILVLVVAGTIIAGLAAARQSKGGMFGFKLPGTGPKEDGGSS